MREVRLGKLLVERGVLTATQIDEVLAIQVRTGEPFGLICERVLDIPGEQIEAAWAEQYAGYVRQIDPEVEPFEERALELITRRQAWQFRVLPIRFEPHELMVATTQENLPRALRFATNVIGVPVFLVLTTSVALGRALCRHYPLPGMSSESLENDDFSRLLTLAQGGDHARE